LFLSNSLTINLRVCFETFLIGRGFSVIKCTNFSMNLSSIVSFISIDDAYDYMVLVVTYFLHNTILTKTKIFD